MEMHLDVARMAARAFADHRFRRGRGLSWIMAKPGTGIYSFRVVWTPGALIVTGDVGDAVYRVWPAFSDPWSAADLVANADFHYLTGKSGFKTEFDRAASVQTLLEQADERQKHSGDRTLWDAIVQWYDWKDWSSDRLRVAQARAGAELRQDGGLSADDIYRLSGSDAELIQYSYPPRARWIYEALQLWAAQMQRREPLWHQLLRRARRLHKALKAYRQRPPIHRPEVYLADTQFNGSRYWRRLTTASGECWRAVTPWQLGPLRFHRIGFWRDQGSSWPGDLNARARLTPVPEACLWP